MINKDGYVYIISNPAMPKKLFRPQRYLKIGLTVDIRSRLRGLFNTSVPLPFVVEHVLYVPDRFAYEAAIHQTLEKYRVPHDREFFYLSPKKAIRLIHGRRSKVFAIVDEIKTSAIEIDENRAPVESREPTNVIAIAKDRTPTSKRLQIEYSMMLERAIRDVKNGKLTNFANAHMRKTYETGGPRVARLKKDLAKMGLIVIAKGTKTKYIAAEKVA